MKVDELMIGDWVVLHNYPRGAIATPELGTYVKVSGIVQDSPNNGECRIEFNVGSKKDWDFLEDCFGIYLTPEILVKNGFVYQDLPFEDFYEGHGLQIHGGKYADGHSNW